jgi:uncharacterized membrane protein YgdD (TMEM256/DUF423 family)
VEPLMPSSADSATDAPRRLPGPLVIGAILIVPFLVLMAALLAHVFGNVPFTVITRDPMATMVGDPLTGAQSVVGVGIWWLAAGICLFASAVASRSRVPPAVRSFLLWSGLLTAVLVLDDAFMFHDDLASRIFGLRERYVMLAYGVLLAAYLLRFRKVILRTEWLLLVGALAFFASSIGLDLYNQNSCLEFVTPTETCDWSMFVEDSLKLLGIVFWSAWLIRISYLALLGGLRSARSMP